MKTFRTAASLVLSGALMIATSVDMSATSRDGIDVVHSFAGGTDGNGPYAALIQATDGNFYGTTSLGGTANMGTVFRMTFSGAVTVLHDFAGGADGASPFAPLIQATDGNLYGTTYSGGASNLGTVFRVTPAGVVTLIYSFAGGVDGANPRAGLLQANDGNLYGTTQFGGTANRGTLFELSTAGAVLGRYMFTGGFDGAYPYGSLIQATDGNLYGTNYGGTISTFGRVFKVVGGAITVLHTFASVPADGANPGAGIVEGNDGNFYGTTLYGGASNNGTAFKMTPGGTVTVLHSFSGGSDGANPIAPLIQEADGSLDGTTRVGASGYGTVYKLTLAGTLTVVHTFTGGADGADSSAALLQAKSGKLYGTTSFGGASGFGTVFRLPVTTPGDFDGDGKTDPAVYFASTGQWWWLDSSTNYTTNNGGVAWGGGNAIPVPGDYDGDGNVDPAVYFPSTGQWWFLYSNTSYKTNNGGVTWGGGNAIPVPGDYDGDGKTDPAIFFPSTGQWWILYSSTGYTTNSGGVSWGGAGTDAIPLPGDYDGDGKTDPAVYFPSTGKWWILYSSSDYTTNSGGVSWGGGGAIPLPGDYDGDGKTDPALYFPSTGQWWILYSSTGYTTNSGPVEWGGGGATAVPGDYDGDGKTDPALYFPSVGQWWILYSSTGYTTNSGPVDWGGGSAIPINERP